MLFSPNDTIEAAFRQEQPVTPAPAKTPLRCRVGLHAWAPVYNRRVLPPDIARNFNCWRFCRLCRKPQLVDHTTNDDHLMPHRARRRREAERLAKRRQELSGGEVMLPLHWEAKFPRTPLVCRLGLHRWQVYNGPDHSDDPETWWHGRYCTRCGKPDLYLQDLYY